MARLRLAIPLLTALALSGTPALAGILGAAESFAVLGASTVTNTGLTTIEGDLGLDPGTSITGFPPGTVTGTTFVGGDAHQAQIDALSVYGAFGSGLPVTSNLSGVDLGTVGTLLPGVYQFDNSAQLTGTLTLDASAANATFIFLIGSTLTTASGAVVNVINASIDDGVYWRVGTAATLGTATQFAGNILADQSITMNTGASLCGRAIALGAAVTLDTNAISNDCGFGGLAGGVVPIPEPSTWILMFGGLLAVAAKARRTGH